MEGETGQGHSRKRGYCGQMHGGAWLRQKTAISWTLVFQGRMMRTEWRLGGRDQIVVVQFICLYKKLGLYSDSNGESVKAFKQR